METTKFETTAPGVHTAEASQRFFGLELGARMTVLETSKGLLVHSPIEVERASVDALGSVRWVLAPNLFHHLYVGPWASAGIECWAPRGLQQKRSDLRFAGEIGSENPFGPELKMLPLASLSLTNEVVVLHRPSKTLVVTDLLFNLPSTTPWFTRTAMRCACAYPGCNTSIVERIAMKRSIAREEIETILSWDFDRIVMSHGDIIESDGKSLMRHAFRWLL